MIIDRTGKIYIKKRTVPEWFTLFVFIFPFIMATLTEFLKLPALVKYSVDVLLICIVVSLAIRKQTMLNKKIVPFVLFFFIFFAYTLFFYLLNFQSVFYYLWGFRNNFRLYIAFFAFVFFFNEEDFENGLKLFDYIFWLNAAVTVFQFFVLGLSRDNLGGIFGTEKGCNCFSIVFLCIVVTKSVFLYMNKQEKMWLCFLKCGVSLVVAAIAELKVYYLFFAFILLCAVTLTRFSVRKLFLIIISLVFILIASQLLVYLFGSRYEISISNMIRLITVSNYATEEDLGRFTAIPTIANTILTEPHEQLFGLGLGNCDTSAFEICNTPFFENYEMLHYTWFSSAFLFLETGYIGLLLYISFFVICFITALKRLKSEGSNELYCKLSMVISMISVILIFYNSTLRTEVVYMLCFALALPFADRLTPYRNKHTQGRNKAIMY